MQDSVVMLELVHEFDNSQSIASFWTTVPPWNPSTLNWRKSSTERLLNEFMAHISINSSRYFSLYCINRLKLMEKVISRSPLYLLWIPIVSASFAYQMFFSNNNDKAFALNKKNEENIPKDHHDNRLCHCFILKKELNLIWSRPKRSRFHGKTHQGLKVLLQIPKIYCMVHPKLKRYLTPATSNIEENNKKFTKCDNWSRKDRSKTESRTNKKLTPLTWTASQASESTNQTTIHR